MSPRTRLVTLAIVAFAAIALLAYVFDKNDREFRAFFTAADSTNIVQVKKDLSTSERGDIIEYRNGHVIPIYHNMTGGKTEGIGYVALDAWMDGEPVKLYLYDVDQNLIKRVVKKSNPDWVELIKKYHSDYN